MTWLCAVPLIVRWRYTVGSAGWLRRTLIDRRLAFHIYILLCVSSFQATRGQLPLAESPTNATMHINIRFIAECSAPPPPPPLPPFYCIRCNPRGFPSCHSPSLCLSTYPIVLLFIDWLCVAFAKAAQGELQSAIWWVDRLVGRVLLSSS